MDRFFKNYGSLPTDNYSFKTVRQEMDSRDTGQQIKGFTLYNRPETYFIIFMLFIWYNLCKIQVIYESKLTRMEISSTGRRIWHNGH